MAENTPLPKSQEQLSSEAIKTYSNPETGTPVGSSPGVSDPKNRALQTSRAEDNVKNLTIGIKDIDESIYYYFNNVLKPNVIQNGKQINDPLVYGSPERWAAMQKDGYYRDKNGKMQAPLIVFRRDSLEKNRNLGNKLDGNHPSNYGIFKKTF